MGRMRRVKHTTSRIGTLFLSTFAATSVVGCAAGEGDDELDEDQEVGTTYVHISEFEGIDQGAWYTLAHRMNDEFDDICGDTFCEGEYSNITPLTLNCGVSSIRGSIRDCAWTFAASQTGVDAFTARIGVDAPRYECHFKPKMNARAFLDTLINADTAIDAVLPGMEMSIYDAIGECFENPIGGTPLTTAGSETPTYVHADSYYATFNNQQKWRDAKAALVADFDRVCGDTFCSGDYSDLQAMELACAITKSTGNVKGCGWVFSGSYSTIATNGSVVETTGSWTCPIAVRGTLSQLITTLNATSTTDPIDRALPGVTTSAYDGLLGCLP
jgi:hypothetical protein